MRPQTWDHWDKLGPGLRPVLQATLSAEAMAEYRRPFAKPGEGRRPTLTWPREIPIEGEPADVAAIAAAYADWLATTAVPKLFVKAEPGAILASDALVDVVRGWPAQAEVTVAGVHFVQEDSPDEIGRAIAGRMGEVEAGGPRPGIRPRRSSLLELMPAEIAFRQALQER